MPKAWNKLNYTILWKGQKLAVTAAADSVEISNETGSAPVTVKVWGKEYTFGKEAILVHRTSSPLNFSPRDPV